VFSNFGLLVGARKEQFIELATCRKQHKTEIHTVQNYKLSKTKHKKVKKSA